MTSDTPFMRFTAGDLAAVYPALAKHGPALEAVCGDRRLALHRGVTAWHGTVETPAKATRIRVSTQEDLEAQLAWVSERVREAS